MNVVEVLVNVLMITQRDTGSSGSASDAANIAQFLAAPANASFALLGSVSGIPFASFFANSPNAFDSLKGRLWQDFANSVGKPTLAEPQWSFDNTTGQIASYLAHANA